MKEELGARFLRFLSMLEKIGLIKILLMRQDKHMESERTLGFHNLKLLFERKNATYSP